MCPAREPGKSSRSRRERERRFLWVAETAYRWDRGVRRICDERRDGYGFFVAAGTVPASTAFEIGFSVCR